MEKEGEMSQQVFTTHSAKSMSEPHDGKEGTVEERFSELEKTLSAIVIEMAESVMEKAKETPVEAVFASVESVIEEGTSLTGSSTTGAVAESKYTPFLYPCSRHIVVVLGTKAGTTHFVLLL